MNRAQPSDRSERYRKFAAAMVLRKRVVGWAGFLLVLLAPFVVVASLDEPNLLYAYFLGFVGIGVISGLIQMRAWKLRTGLWLEIELLRSYDVGVLVLLAAVMATPLFAFLVIVRYDVQIGIFLGDTLVLLTCLLVLLAAMYLLQKRRQRKYGNMRVRFVRGKRDEVAATICAALDSIRAGYEHSVKGSQWTSVVSSFLFGNDSKRVEVRMQDRWYVTVYKWIDPASGHAISPVIDRGIDDSLDTLDKTSPHG